MGRKTASRGDTLAHNMSFHVTNSIFGKKEVEKEKCAVFLKKCCIFINPAITFENAAIWPRVKKICAAFRNQTIVWDTQLTPSGHPLFIAQIH